MSIEITLFMFTMPSYGYVHTLDGALGKVNTIIIYIHFTQRV